MVLPVNKKYLNELQSLFFRFIWDRGKDKIKRSIMHLPVEEGGLNVPNLEIFSKTIKMIWIKKLLNNEDFSPWKHLILSKLIPFGGNLIWFYDTNHLKKLHKNLNPFWSCVLEAWQIFKTETPSTTDEALSQPLWYNRHIQINRKTIFFKYLHQAGVNFINDLLKQNGHFFTYKEFIDNYEVNVDFLSYNAIIHAIPQIWKTWKGIDPKKLTEIKKK